MQRKRTGFRTFAALQVRLGIVALVLGLPPAFAQSAALHLQEIRLTAEGEARVVLFQFSHPPDSIRSFSLSSPSRIVIDVHGPVQNVPSRIYQAEDVLLTHVRTGSHPQRLRLVLDLSGQTVPAHSVEHHETRVLAKLGKPGGEQDGGPPPVRTQVLFSRSQTTLASQRGGKSPAPVLAAVPTPSPPSPRVDLTPSPSSEPLSQQARYHLEQGQILYDAGKVDEAIGEWREALRLAPQAARAHHLLGLAFRDQKDHTQAAAAFQQALRIEPDNATAHVHLARAFEALGKEQEAFDTYQKALQLVPSAPYVHNRLGYILAGRKDWQGAANEWYQTIQLAPHYAYAYANYGEALEKMGRQKDALSTYKNAVPICVRFTQAFEERRKKSKAEALCAEIRKRVTRLRGS